MPNENNVAAQAGDEPMRDAEIIASFEAAIDNEVSLKPGDTSYWVRKDELLAWFHAVSPRATADVERNLRAELINAGALRQFCHNDGSVGFVTAYDFDITNRFLAAIATTKPGA